MSDVFAKGRVRNSLEGKLLAMDDSEFDRIETLARGNEEVDQWKDSHRWFVRSVIDDRSEKNRSLYLNAVEAFDDDYQEWADVRVLRSLRKIPEFAPYAEDFRKAPAEMVEAAHRLGEYRNELMGYGGLYHDAQSDIRFRSRKLESIIINEPDRASALIDWVASNLGKDLTELDSELALRVIDHPEDRDYIAETLAMGFNDTKIIALLLDRPESRDEILDLYNGGIKNVDSIVEVLEGRVKSSFASGIL